MSEVANQTIPVEQSRDWVVDARARTLALVADLTESVKSEGTLRFDANQKTWVLELVAEFDGDKPPPPSPHSHC